VSKFDDLKQQIRQLFELDKADLDFGIYRVLRARHGEITEFLDKHLEKSVHEALQTHGDLQTSQIKDDLAKAEQAARDAGIEPKDTPKVKELQEKLTAGADIEALSSYIQGLHSIAETAAQVAAE